MGNGCGVTTLPQTLIDAYSAYVADKQRVALITVLQTDGSTYSKVGAQMLIGEDGSSFGLLSGGCLENDLKENSAAAIEAAVTQWIEYDLRSDDDLFGLGVGCEGSMCLQIQPLEPESGYAPLSGWLAQLEESPVIDACFKTGNDQPPVIVRFGRPHEVLVLGAGPDAKPLIEFGRNLGWRLTVFDHRPAYIAAFETKPGCRFVCAPVGQLRDEVELERYDAAVVMSHHLVSDREYLQALSQTSTGFVGLLGPPHRRDRLLSEIGAAADRLANRLRSPVGKRIGGRGPAAIALEVTAELQSYFSALRVG
jgi:xanthine/CO dehydrogenase XdhC/CoxF family maturation factor